VTTTARPGTHLHGHWLTIARAAWGILALFSLLFYVYWSIHAIQQPLPDCSPPAAVCNPLFLSAVDVAVAEGSLLPAAWLARSFFFLNVLTSLAFILVALFIVWRKSDDWMALLISALILSLGAFGYTPDDSALILPGSLLDPLVGFVAFIGYFGPITALFYFPDGQFVPRWSRWVCLALIITVGITFLTDFIVAWQTSQFWTFLPVFLFVYVGVGIGCMIYRYRRVASPSQKQQIKWVAVGLIIVPSGVITWLLFDTFLPPVQPSPMRTLLVAVTFPIIAMSTTFLPISVAIALVRYRLWDVDILIRRTLQYTVVTGLLALIYLGGVLVFQGIFSSLTGSADSPIIIVISTLTIAALFNPLRERVQAFIDRRFYRQKYDAQQVLAQFAQIARDEVDMAALQAELLKVVQETMQPERVSIWLKE
jgi:hypothetical protein